MDIDTRIPQEPSRPQGGETGPNGATASFNLDRLIRSIGKRLVEVAKLVKQDKQVPGFHRVPFYLSALFSVLAFVLPLLFLSFGESDKAVTALFSMAALLGVSLLGVCWTTVAYQSRQTPPLGTVKGISQQRSPQPTKQPRTLAGEPYQEERQRTTVGERGIHISGDANSATIITGDRNQTVGPT